MAVRLLVTGGSGFIGTNVVKHYTDKGIPVLNIDVKAPKTREQDVYWKQVDILDKDGLENAVFEFDPTHVIHLAARTDLDETKDIEGYKVNMKGVENVIDALDKCRNLKRVMFASSQYVCEPGIDPKDYEYYAPHTVYGESKVQTEKIIKAKALSGFEWVLIRPTSIWGPWFGYPYNDFFHHVNSKTYFNILGKTTTKTYGFIGNSIYQMNELLFADANLVHKKTFYIGDHPGLNINEWAKEIAYQLNISLIPMPLFVIRIGSLVGDVLNLAGIKFPLQSFRMKNMTTDNIITLLKDTWAIAPEKPYDIKKAVAITLNWLKQHDDAFSGRTLRTESTVV